MIVITAIFKAKPGQEKELEEALKTIIPKVQEEEGTVRYTLHRAQGEAGQFLFYEMYKDKAALDYHGSTPYFKEFSAQIGGLLAAKPQITIYEDIASISR